MPDYVRITDVSPRDGLQNEPGIIPTPEKVRLIELLAQTGVDEIEVTSFVSPKWVPQLGDAKEVLQVLNVRGRATPPEYAVLVPNAKGFESGLSLDVFDAIDKIALFTAASETFSRKNTNCSIAESIERFRPLVLRAHDQRWHVRAYVSTVIACPFEGPMDPERVADVVERFAALEPDEIDLGDTIGAGTPETVQDLLQAVRRRIDPMYFEYRGGLTLHLHDTFARAKDCVLAALDMGVRSFDGSVAGLGGCPYASKKLPNGTIQRAPGNISTELLVRTIHAAGYETGVDLDRLAEAAAYAQDIVTKSRSASAQAESGGSKSS
jgi:hydroxymethylglutaryl-CoA lyase